jgi:hypothetical protein
MIDDHILGRTRSQTEFTSWTQSLETALGLHWLLVPDPRLVTYREAGENLWISMIDTWQLRNSNPALHAKALEFLVHRTFNGVDFLVHGIISGPALRSAPLKTFMQPGLWELQRHQPRSTLFGEVETLDSALIIPAKTIGEAYGGIFAIPMTLAVLCLIRRDLYLLRK